MVCEVDSPWVDGLTIGQVLQKTVERYADRDAHEPHIAHPCLSDALAEQI